MKKTVKLNYLMNIKNSVMRSYFVCLQDIYKNVTKMLQKYYSGMCGIKKIILLLQYEI
jgi:hypothetical protein